MDSASTRRGPRFTVPRVALPAFLIATRCQLDMPPSRWKQTKASPSNRNKTRLLISRLLGSAAPALSVRLRASQVHLEASAMRVLDCGFRRVIAYPPGGGAVTLIQTQRANSQLEVPRHEMPVWTIASLLRSVFRLPDSAERPVGARHAVPASDAVRVTPFPVFNIRFRTSRLQPEVIHEIL
jgi:hypothetical protein